MKRPTQEDVARHLAWIDQIEGRTLEAKATARRVWEQVSELTNGEAPVPAAWAMGDSVSSDEQVIGCRWSGGEPSRNRLVLGVDIRDDGLAEWMFSGGHVEGFVTWFADQLPGEPLPPELGAHFSTLLSTADSVPTPVS